MAKAKLKFDVSYVERAKVAAELTDIKLGTGTKLGNTAVVEVTFRSPNDLVNFGMQLATLPADTRMPEAPVAVPAPAKATAKAK